MKIIVSDFVMRQTPDSRFSHYEGPWKDIARHAEEHFEKGITGYRDGVVLVPVLPKGYYSGIAQLHEGTSLTGGFESRREGEAPRKFVTSVGATKLPAKHVDIVLYSSTVLAEDGDNHLPPEAGNWEIISVNASPTKDSPPIDPMVLMHNHFGSAGGTATGLSDEDFIVMLRESFYFWKDKAMCS